MTRPEDLARELAALTGGSITDVVIAALRDRREKLRQPSQAEYLAALLAITDQTSAVIAREPGSDRLLEVLVESKQRSS